MDYRELLVKYIDHVGCCEGVSFLSNRYEGNFTDEKWDELQKLDKESELKYGKPY